MKIEDLVSVVGEDKKGELDTLLEGVKQTGNPLAALKDKPELFGGILKDNADFAKVFDAEVGSRVTKGLESGIESWQKTNLDKIYQKRYAEEHPNDTEDQKRLKAVEITLSEAEARATTADLRATTLESMTADKISGDLLELMIGTDAEVTKGKITIFKDWLSKHDEELKTEILKTNGRIPGETDETHNDRFYTVQQMNEMSPTEQFENQAKFDESYTYHQNLARAG